MDFVSKFYLITFLVSFILTIIYAFHWHKHFETSLTLVFFLIPIVNLGYVFLSFSQNLQTAVISMKQIFLGGCFLIYFLTLSIFSLCNIPVKRTGRIIGLTVFAFCYAMVLTAGYKPYFYKNLSFSIVDGHGVLYREYGPAHTFFYITVLICFLLGLGTIIYAYFKKKQVSRKILLLLFLPELVTVICYFGKQFIRSDIEFVPLGYVFAQIMYLAIIRRISLYDVSDTATDSLLQAESTGFVSFDHKGNYIGSNTAAQKAFPELLELTVDLPVNRNKLISDLFLSHLEEFRKKQEALPKKPEPKKDLEQIIDAPDEPVKKTEPEADDVFYYQRNEESPIYAINIQNLYDGYSNTGYQFMIQDDTRNQKYQADLESEVAKKTANLVAMHNRLILSMATMVESRDNSTGGHIKRTSEGVRILIEEMRKDPSFRMPDKFCNDLIKSAPMHDLGKIAVDDAILRKPGRFTPEEFEKMKVHAAEGARIVHEILKDTDDDEFRRLAENVAHYHHERMDGSGYPEGLKGDAIPLEARIMAIADVYDALVSKRVYKEAMSFEKANDIMMEGMGPHFDPALKQYYVSARPKLEAYYRSLD